MCSAHRVRDCAILYSLVKVNNPWNCSLLSTRRFVHSQWIIKHDIRMDYTSTLEALECFWMAFSRCSEHQIRACAILYPFVKVSDPRNCSLLSTRFLVHSQSFIKHAILMDYTSTLEIFESFWNALSRCSECLVGALAILYPLVNLSSPGNSSW